ncbi:MAG: exodeoxyribonuclease VII small subunit [Deltaproteobacteria bacterium]|nr:MAG: exodeoxyribonuclease VII small subunit [Deltaproteobacteria bacterium]TNF31799.1 MAG: exodeoxyribonuclease VII small subunit [Deltaproteobacteria bacterium]
MSDKKTQTFETQLEKLEEIVGQLESGELNLDDSLKKFEEGVQLFKSCKDKLSKAEKKIAQLNESLNEEELD